ncbi:hypothetical protein [Clostridium luticellarii]|jgi:hypothetical protein|uniref:hypothetical protein n=1 Tax=Clostridium luticellarii TaxID=1691940 RepID=UPI002352B8B1|nr:hypothetical protein [Clostridium luticellarii]MCI1945591.1 hypothetical protein [Clostridium luticellarii]
MLKKEDVEKAIQSILDTAIETNSRQMARAKLLGEGLESCPDEWRIQANDLYEILRFNTEMRDDYITFLRDLKKELEYIDDTDKLYDLALDINKSLKKLDKTDYKYTKRFDGFTKNTLGGE